MPKYKVYEPGVRHARALVRDGKVVRDERDDWSEHAPSADEGTRLIEKDGIKDYAKWYLAIDADEDPENKGAYAFPYGDFKKVHRCGVISAKGRAAQYDHKAVEDAADEILEMIDSKADAGTGKKSRAA